MLIQQANLNTYNTFDLDQSWHTKQKITLLFIFYIIISFLGFAAIIAEPIATAVSGAGIKEVLAKIADGLTLTNAETSMALRWSANFNIIIHSIYLFGSLAVLGPDIKELNLKIDMKKIKFLAICFAIMYGWNILSSNLIPYIVQAIDSDAGASSQNQLGIVRLFQDYPVQTFVMVVILAPISEELLYRVGVVGFFSQRFKPLVGLILGSILFGLAHTMGDIISGDWLQLIWTLNYVGTGFMFGYVYLKTQSFGSAWFLHFANNFLAFIGMWMLSL